MAEIAVDIVLLPQEEMADKVISANKELLKQYAHKIVLDRERCLPHISLAMGCIDDIDIDEIGTILTTIAQETSLGQLNAVGIKTETNQAGEKVPVLEIEKTEALQSLHEEVMKKLSEYFSYDVRPEMVLSSAQTSQSTLDWIKNYPEKSSFENFFPHITIGYGEINKFPFPIKFTVSKLALCHLGNHCTCRIILASANLIKS
ncbi:MAG: 2'-5' RNA ligase family protein [Sedimentisphaerales bacterium]|nr:2'-5' RNA ligase family protein [Sedimentisphaerales bacterium]